jgi:hypothetical protein
MITLALVLCPLSALCKTEWLGKVNQWSVGFDSDNSMPFCRLNWDSELGMTVEFRANRTEVTWLIAKDGWSIPQGTKITVRITGRSMRLKVPAVFHDAKSLQLWDSQDNQDGRQIKSLLTQAFSGMPDIELSFPGSETDWVLPLSRVAPLHSAFVDCMKRLQDGSSAKADPTATEPF